MGRIMSKQEKVKEGQSPSVDLTVKRAYQCGKCDQCIPDTNQQLGLSQSGCYEGDDACKTPRQDENDIALQLNAKSDANSQRIININQLPASTLIKIFSYLKKPERLLRMSFVCRHWEKLCRDADLWREIDVSGQKHITDDILLNLVSYSNNVTYLDMSDCYNDALTENGMQAVIKKCPNLQHLLIMRCGNSRYTDKALTTLPQDCPNLKTLRMDSLEITDSTLINIAEHLNKLEYLGLSQILSITDKAVTAVVKSCPNLKRLRLAQNNQLKGEFIHEIPNGTRKLQHFDMMMTNIQPQLVPKLSCLRDLKNLNLSQCETLELEHIMPVFDNCLNIETLSLNLVRKLDDTWVEIFVKKLTKIDQLFLISTDITDRSMEMISLHLKHLMNIDVGYTQVTHVGVKHIADSCKQMKLIGLIQCGGVDEEVIEEMVPQYPNIHISTFQQDTKRILLKAQKLKK